MTKRQKGSPQTGTAKMSKKNRALRAHKNSHMEKQIHPIRWKSKTIYVDMATGEQITKRNAEKNYSIIKTLKNVTLNYLKTAGNIEYTKQCRSRQQLELFTTD